MTSSITSHLLLFCRLIVLLILCSLVHGQVNVALNKPASQTSDLEWNGFFWTADKAVDGCLLRDDSENQQCCSSSLEVLGDNFWTVDLGEMYLVESIIIFGRSDTPSQLENFQAFVQEVTAGQEFLIFDSLGENYGDGTYRIALDTPRLARYIVIRRPAILTLCEVQVFVGQTDTTPTTTSQVTSTEASCPAFTYGEFCDPCGNCLNNESCDVVDGTCPSGCAAGYFGTICNLECPAGLYGPGCFGLCGNCLGGQPCDAVTGQCTLGCAPGWTTSLCNETCADGSYGIQCASFCGNCINNEPCDKESGTCTSGCAAGWTGVLCDTLAPTNPPLSVTTDTSTVVSTADLTENVAQNKPATQFSTLDYLFFWTADKAVDGCLLRDDPDNQQCCSATEGGSENFWTVDLQEQYLVYRIVVTGRPADFSGQLENFTVYTRQEQFFPELEVYDNTEQPYNDGIFTIDIPAPSLVQYVTLRRPSGNIMVICEVEVYASIEDTTVTSTTSDPTTTTATEMVTTTTETSTTGECPPFTYGEFCDPCGNCLNSEPCDSNDGTCVSGCAAGYFGTICDLECPAGLYGPGCFGLCGNCLDGQPCDGVTGQCTLGCAPGWTTSLCNETCPDGSYGIQCTSFCGNCINNEPCDKESGTCTSGCATGWTGVLCDTLSPTVTTTIPTAPTSGQTTPPAAGENVALNKPATQFSTLDYFFFWTADKAVDGCLLRDDPDNQQCCSATEGGFENFWTVDLQEQYLVYRIVVTGRLADFSGQLEDFTVYTRQEQFFPELEVYDNTGQPYNGGIFTIDIPAPSLVQYVTLRRPSGNIMVICEVEVYAFIEDTTTTLTTLNPTTTTTVTATTTTTVSPTTTTDIPTAPTSRQTTAPTVEENVALNKPATQFSTLDYLFFWTADKAVDGCLLRDDPDNQQCCSATEGGSENFWTVDLQEQYLVTRIVVTGRPVDFRNQLENFAIYIQQNEFSAEVQVYDNFGQPYNDGIFLLEIPIPGPAQFVTLRRPLGSIMVICEVEVYAVIPDITTASTTLNPTTTTTTEMATITTTVSPTFTTTTPTVPTSRQTTSPTAYENVALNKPATQFSTLDYFFFWTADKAVDGCLLRDDPDNQECCSATEGGSENFWTVDLQEQYLLTRIVVTGRLAEFRGQLENFTVYTRQEQLFPELEVYDNTGQPYNGGIFTIDIPAPSLVQYVTLRRPSGSIMVICEVEVYAFIEDTTTTTTTLDPTTTTTEMLKTTTVSPTFTTTITAQTSGQTTPPFSDENVALNKPATQFSTLDYLFFWTADKAVDGCLLRDDPDNQQCCSATEGGSENFWTVNLQEQYLVSRIVVTGRPTDFSNQLENFSVYIQQDEFSAEVQVYDNFGQPYNDGIFLLEIPIPGPVQFVTIRRPLGSIMVICEVEVYAVEEDTTTSTTLSPTTTTTEMATTTITEDTTTTSTTTTTTEMLTTTTVSPSFTTSIPTAPTSGQNTPPTANENIALNKPASQFSTLDYLFFWTADKAVDGCILRDDPDNQQCCSATEGGSENFWTVDLQEQYLVYRIVVTGRPADFSNQLENFAMYIQQDEFSTEVQVYDNFGQPYNDGVFLVEIPIPSPAQFVTLRRPLGSIMVICEVEVYAVAEDTTTTSSPTTITTEMATTTARPTSMTNIPTAPTSGLTTPSTAYENVALNKPATQFSTLDYLFFWTADKAVDGCLLRDDPDNQQCCSATEGGSENFWTVDLQEQYLVTRIVVTGRPAEFSGQLEDFTVYTRQEQFFPELEVYDNTGQPYNDGIFTIDIPAPSLVQYVTLRRPSGNIMVICEVEVYAFIEDTTTTSTTLDPTTTTTEMLTTTTVSRTFTTTIPTEPTSGQTTPPFADENVALNKPATQFSTLDYLFFWTADKAVDGCLLRDDPDNQQCCSATEGGSENFWIVDLQEQFLVSRIIVTGRPADFSSQLENFAVYIQQDEFSAEVQVYDNFGQPYNDGIFLLEIPIPSPAQFVTFRRPLGSIMVICEVEVYAVQEDTTTTSTTLSHTTTTTEMARTTTVSQTPTTTVPTATTSGLTTTSMAHENIALNKPATQFSTLDYFFFWTADKAVDGCLLRDDPDNQQCCSATEGGSENFWTVDLQEQYLVSRIVVTGRPADFSGQLENFTVYTRQEQFFPELEVYDNTGQPYNDGIFTIDIPAPSLVQYVTLRRLSGSIMVICEVEVYAFIGDTTTTSTTLDLTTTTTELLTTTTVSPTFTTTIPTTPTSGQTTPPFADENVALNKPATQFSTLDYLFFWTADKAVDGCLLRDDPDNQQCCSATEGGSENFWTVNLQEQYLVYRIVVTGRPADFSNQLENFAVYIQQDEFSTEVQVYSNFGQPYSDGIFLIEIPIPILAQFVTLRRLLGSIMVICEVEVYADENPTTTSSSSITTTHAAIATSAESCPENTYGENCTPCGNCLTFLPCNSETGECAVGCLPGWQPPLCNTSCESGFYGIDCELTCGACLFGVPCDVVTGVCPGACEPEWQGDNCDILITTASMTSATSNPSILSSEGSTTTIAADMNVALNKPATQFSTLNYLFFWTADKAVDGCLLRDDPDNQQCCSATEGGPENFWTVDLQGQYLVSRIVVTGRPADNSVQLEGFLLYTTESPTVPETLLYNNSLYPYDEGIFIIEVQPPQIVQSVTVRRPSGTILVLCEMEVFGVLISATSSPTTPIVNGTDLPSKTSSIETTQIPTQVSSEGSTETSASSSTQTSDQTQTSSSEQTSLSTLTVISTETSSTTQSSSQTSSYVPTQSSISTPSQVTTSNSSPTLSVVPTQSSTASPSQASAQSSTSTSNPGLTQSSTAGSSQGPTQGSTAGPSQGPTQSSTQGQTISTQDSSRVTPTAGNVTETTAGDAIQYDGSARTAPGWIVVVSGSLLVVLLLWSL